MEQNVYQRLRHREEILKIMQTRWSDDVDYFRLLWAISSLILLQTFKLTSHPGSSSERQLCVFFPICGGIAIVLRAGIGLPSTMDIFYGQRKIALYYKIIESFCRNFCHQWFKRLDYWKYSVSQLSAPKPEPLSNPSFFGHWCSPLVGHLIVRSKGDSTSRPT